MSADDRTNLRSAYLYLVCLITLVMILFAAVNVVRGTVQILYPDPAPFAYEPAYGPEGGQELAPAERAEREQAIEESQRHQAVLSLVGSGAMLAIAGPAYLYHWRRVQSELRRSAPAPVG
jgi:hypothetical protein